MQAREVAGKGSRAIRACRPELRLSPQILKRAQVKLLGASTSLLHAYDANKLSREFYNSDQNAASDALGSSVKFAPPLVKVYVGTRDSLVVYGTF